MRPARVEAWPASTIRITRKGERFVRKGGFAGADRGLIDVEVRNGNACRTSGIAAAGRGLLSMLRWKQRNSRPNGAIQRPC